MQTDAIHLPAIPAADLESPPLAQADTIPSRWYWDPAFDRLDRDAVFARTWQGVGHAGQVPWTARQLRWNHSTCQCAPGDLPPS